MRETCEVDVWDGWHSHPCGRKIKEDGLCGLHLSAKGRREAVNLARQETRRALRELAGHFSAFDVHARPSPTGGEIILSESEAKKLLAILKERA